MVSTYLIIFVRPSIEMQLQFVILEIMVDYSCDTPIVDRVFGVDVNVEQVQRLLGIVSLLVEFLLA